MTATIKLCSFINFLFLIFFVMPKSNKKIVLRRGGTRR